MDKKIIIIIVITIFTSISSTYFLMDYNFTIEQNKLINELAPYENQYEITDEEVLFSNGQEHLIQYDIKNGQVTDMWYSKDANSLNLKIDSSNYGLISLTIPREFFDYPEDNQGETLMILNNGKESFLIDTSNEMNHRVHFAFTDSDPTIEVIGAFIP